MKDKPIIVLMIIGLLILPVTLWIMNRPEPVKKEIFKPSSGNMFGIKNVKGQ